MKILIITAFLITTQAHAQDAVACSTKASNLALAMKARGFISSQLQTVVEKEYNGKLPDRYSGPYQDPKITTDKVCASVDSQQWEEARSQKKISLKLLAGEIKTKGKVSGTLAAGIDETADKDMTPKELCASLAKSMENTDYLTSFDGNKCDSIGRLFHKEISSVSYLDKSFAEVCRDLYPKLKNHHIKMVDCEKGIVQPEIKSEVPNTTKAQPQNLPRVEEKKFRYLKPTGASAQ